LRHVYRILAYCIVSGLEGEGGGGEGGTCFGHMGAQHSSRGGCAPALGAVSACRHFLLDKICLVVVRRAVLRQFSVALGANVEPTCETRRRHGIDHSSGTRLVASHSQPHPSVPSRQFRRWDLATGAGPGTGIGAKYCFGCGSASNADLMCMKPHLNKRTAVQRSCTSATPTVQRYSRYI
jgi:hypothetical protein